jgi:thiosulfate/3-mercaptopyruvate sulfurtransferase
MYTTLITAEQLLALQAAKARLMVFDCTSDLMDPASGEKQYLQSHIPGAVYADLDHALSDKGSPDAHSGEPQPHPGAASGGRHPLPSREKFAMWLSAVGFANDMQAVVYDRNNANYCGRLWWMLKWAGHDAVAVLDGGLQAWQAAGGAVRAGPEPSHFQSNFELGEPLRRLVVTEEVVRGLGKDQVLIDARGAQRFRGEVEPIDPVAGHIPGALNRPFAQNMGPDGRFKPPQELRAEFEQLLAGRDPANVVHHCGSGVSAVPNVIAMELAGFGPTGLYAGSWSEWCRDPKLPVEQG